MEVVDKVISLLNDYKNTGDRFTVLEALHYVEKLADINMKPKARKDMVKLVCGECSFEYYSKFDNSVYCPECKLKHKREKQRERKLILKQRSEHSER